MRTATIASLSALLMGAGFSFAQYPWPNAPAAPVMHPRVVSAPIQSMLGVVAVAAEEAVPPPAAPPAPPAPNLTTAPVYLSTADTNNSGSRFWASTEYLLWWIRNSSVPNPILAVDGVAPFAPPILGAPGVQVLEGGKDYSYGNHSGIRATIGAALDAAGGLGIEIGGFVLERQSIYMSHTVRGATSQILGRPFFNLANTPQAILFGGGGAAIGVAQDSLSNRLWGAEGNLTYNLSRGDRLSVDLLGGFRYLNFDEELRLKSTETIAGNTVLAIDEFKTPNEFYGGQLGARLRLVRGSLSADLTTKIALGASDLNQEVIGQRGYSPPQPGAGAVLPSGIYAQTTNAGSRDSHQFAVVLDLNAKVSYQFASWLRASVGYDFLYWDKVLRAGSQIDPVINSPVTTFMLPFTPLSRTAGLRPAPVSNTSEFWAHGVNFGVELRY